MLDKCILDGKYQQAIGMVIECGRLDKLEEAVLRSDNVHSTINYCIVVSHSFVNRREYRLEKERIRSRTVLSCAICGIYGDWSNLDFEVYGLSQKECIRSSALFSCDICVPEHAQLPESAQPDSAQTEIAVTSEDVQMTKGTQADKSSTCADPREAVYAERLTKIRGILNGETSIQLTLQFLYSHNK
ncbi:hypothetical protein C2S52_005334 [Perilla frutescens var. hirtella]|nr:hypothetical protein C2S52_005334 [Perilla frutescens var. hirtella]